MPRGTRLALLFNSAGKKQTDKDTPLSLASMDKRLNVTSRNWITADKTIEDIFDCVNEDLTGRETTRILYRLPIEGEFEVGTVAPLSAYTWGVAAAPSGTSTNKIVTVTVDGTVLTFTLTLPTYDNYPAETTGAIAIGASAATVRRALEAFDNIGYGNVAVGKVGNVYTIEFQNKRGKAPVATLTASVLTGTGGVAVLQTQAGAQKTAAITELTTYQPPYTTLAIALEDEAGSERLLIGAVFANLRLRGAAGATGLVTFTADIIFRKWIPAPGLTFPTCVKPRPVRTADCAFSYKGTDYSTILRSFDALHDNGILTGDTAQTGRGVYVSRLERANRRTRTLAISLLQGVTNALYEEAEGNPEANAYGATVLRVGTPGENLTLTYPNALPELAGGGVTFDNEAEEAVNNFNFVPTKQGTTPPSNITAYVNTTDTYLST